MEQFLFYTKNEWTGFILRVVIGGIMFPHGAQKMLGWFGGYGFQSTLSFFTQTMKLPWVISFLVICIEFLGSIALIAGFGSRLWAVGFIAIMAGAIYTTNLQHGLFMNWFGNQSGEGCEYHLLVIGMCVAVLVTGSGKFSVDLLLSK